MFESCCKVFLGITSFIYVILGMAMGAIGVVLAFFPGEILGPVYDDVVDDMTANNAQFAIFASSSDIEDLPFIYELGLFLMVMGILLTIVAFLGMFSACCSSCCGVLLLVFAIGMGVYLVVEIVFYSLFLSTDSGLHTDIKDNLKDEINDPWDDMSTDTYTQAINLINYNFDCCGIDGVEDFSRPPLSCRSYVEGCYSELTDLIDDNIVYIGLGVGFFLLIQLLQLICAVIIFKDTLANKIFPG